MLDQVLDFFDIKPDYDLDLMKPDQNLFSLTSDIVLGLKPILDDFKPDYVYVHGDTTTTMASSIAAFYSGAKVCHVEAGLRTQNKLSPFPEEINRQVTGRIADYHFTPTIQSKENLLQENVYFAIVYNASSEIQFTREQNSAAAILPSNVHLALSGIPKLNLIV
jgi:UDP-N-acetylglucosamine 2-epimerase (non-hydrolysing)